MTVHFIGAGPGDPDLITVRGLRLIQSCPVCFMPDRLCPPNLSPKPLRALWFSTPHP